MGRPKSPNPKLCIYDGCGLKHYAGGFCKKHYGIHWRLKRKKKEMGQ